VKRFKIHFCKPFLKNTIPPFSAGWRFFKKPVGLGLADMDFTIVAFDLIINPYQRAVRATPPEDGGTGGKCSLHGLVSRNLAFMVASQQAKEYQNRKEISMRNDPIGLGKLAL
jgi:hypothetical protein